MPRLHGWPEVANRGVRQGPGQRVGCRFGIGCRIVKPRDKNRGARTEILLTVQMEVMRECVIVPHRTRASRSNITKPSGTRKPADLRFVKLMPWKVSSANDSPILPWQAVRIRLWPREVGTNNDRRKPRRSPEHTFADAVATSG